VHQRPGVAVGQPRLRFHRQVHPLLKVQALLAAQPARVGRGQAVDLVVVHLREVLVGVGGKVLKYKLRQQFAAACR